MQFGCALLLCGVLIASAVPASLIHPTWTWGQKIVPVKRFAPSDRGGASIRVPTKTEAKPFLPFFDLGAPAGPIRSDGTFKGRVPGDTLVPSSKGAYTTLDKLQKGLSKGGQKRPHKKLRGGLGGLDPEEVYYADEDLIIIKGGGFGANSDASYFEPSQEIEFRDALNIPLGKPVKIPSPGEEYNGNIPTILPPPSLAASRFSPLSLFLPSSIIQRGQASSLRHTYTPLPHTRNHFAFTYIPNRAWRFPYPYHAPTPVLLPCSFFHFSPLTPAPNTNALEKGNVYIQLNPQHQHKGFHHGVKEPTGVVVPLHGDTDVNYLDPLPHINPDAEVFLPHPKGGEGDETRHDEEFPSHQYKHTPKKRGEPKL